MQPERRSHVEYAPVIVTWFLIPGDAIGTATSAPLNGTREQPVYEVVRLICNRGKLDGGLNTRASLNEKWPIYNALAPSPLLFQRVSYAKGSPYSSAMDSLWLSGNKELSC
jgi:hypothetical protein